MGIVNSHFNVKVIDVVHVVKCYVTKKGLMQYYSFIAPEIKVQ